MNSREALEEWHKADKVDVDDFNAQWGWGGIPPLETQVSFLRHRLTKTMTMVSVVLGLMLDERDSVGKNDE